MTGGLLIEDLVQLLTEVFADESPDQPIELALAVFLDGDKSEIAVMILALAFDPYGHT